MPKKENRIDLKRIIDREFCKSIVNEAMPDFQKAIDDVEADTIIMTQAAFGTTMEEKILMACMIKHAGNCGKVVTIIPHEETEKEKGGERK